MQVWPDDVTVQHIEQLSRPEAVVDGALEPGTRSGSALGDSDQLPTTLGDFTWTGCSEADDSPQFAVAPPAGGHIQGTDSQRLESLDPRCPQPVRRTTHILHPQRVCSGQEHVNPQVFRRNEVDQTTTRPTSDDLEACILNPARVEHRSILCAGEHQGRTVDLVDTEGPPGEIVVRTMQLSCTTTKMLDGPIALRRHVHRPKPVTLNDVLGNPGRRRRRAARAVVLDPQERVLLINASDPAARHAGDWWEIPGGGIDPGESAEQAIRRELWEEAGIGEAEVGPCIWTQTVQFTFGGWHFDQDEWIHIVRCDGSSRGPAGLESLERLAFGVQQWWPLEQMIEQQPRTIPYRMTEFLPDVLSGMLPIAPVDISPEPVHTDRWFRRI